MTKSKMLKFNTLDGEFYSIPRKFGSKHKGHFDLYNDGDIPMTSNQINFILFDIDDFKLDEFVQSIPIIFQFSIEEFDMKVMKKIQNIMQWDQISNIEDNFDPLYNLISGSISETSTFEDLKTILLKYKETDWRLNEINAKKNLGFLEFSQKIEYFVKINKYDIFRI